MVGSAAAVDARDNTSTTGIGMPIYWLNGAKVAADNADFYDDSWDSLSPKDERGQAGGGPVATVDLFAPLSGLTYVRLDGNPGFDDFVPVVEVSDQRVGAGGVRVDLEATLGASPWGDNANTFKDGDVVEITVTFDEAVKAQDTSPPNSLKFCIFVETLADTHVAVAIKFEPQDHPNRLVLEWTAGTTALSPVVDDDGFCIRATGEASSSNSSTDTLRMEGTRRGGRGFAWEWRQLPHAAWHRGSNHARDLHRRSPCLGSPRGPRGSRRPRASGDRATGESRWLHGTRTELPTLTRHAELIGKRATLRPDIED